MKAHVQLCPSRQYTTGVVLFEGISLLVDCFMFLVFVVYDGYIRLYMCCGADANNKRKANTVIHA